MSTGQRQSYKLKKCSNATPIHHIAKLNVDSFSIDQAMVPVKLYRGPLHATELENNEEINDTISKPKETQLMPKSKETKEKKEQKEQKEVKDDEEKEEKGKKRFQQKQRTKVYLDGHEAYDESKQLRRREHYPWLLEDSGGFIQFYGKLEGSQEANYVLFVYENDGFSVIPCREWYKFNQRITYRTLTTDEAEEQMKSKRQTIDRWMMHKQVNPLPAASSVEKKMKKEDDDDIEAKRVEEDEMLFEDVFEDDEEYGEELEEEQDEEKEQKKKVLLPSLEEDEEEEQMLPKKGQKEEGKEETKKLLKKMKENFQDEDDQDPYANSDEELSDEEEEEEELEKKKPTVMKQNQKSTASLMSTTSMVSSNVSSRAASPAAQPKRKQTVQREVSPAPSDSSTGSRPLKKQKTMTQVNESDLIQFFKNKGGIVEFSVFVSTFKNQLRDADYKITFQKMVSKIATKKEKNLCLKSEYNK